MTKVFKCSGLFKFSGAMALAAIAGGGSAYANVIVGQDDFDSNRTAQSFLVDPAIGTFTADADIFEIVSYSGSQNVSRLSSSTATRSGKGPMRPEIDGNAFWVSDLDGSENPNSDGHGTITWVFDVSGHSDLEMQFDMSFFGNLESGPDARNGADKVTVSAGFDGDPLSIIAESTHSDGGTKYTTHVVAGDPTVNDDHDTFTLGGVLFEDNLPTPISLGIQGSGSLLQLQIRVDGFNSSSEQLVFDNIVISSGIPEPGSLALLGLGGLALIPRRRRV